MNNMLNATLPHRNILSHANWTRNEGLLKKLFWKTVEHYQQTYPQFFSQDGRGYFMLAKCFKRAIRGIDSTTIELIAKCRGLGKT